MVRLNVANANVDRIKRDMSICAPHLSASNDAVREWVAWALAGVQSFFIFLLPAAPLPILTL
ncbi:hypothetical protein [Nioella sp.]|uniref:hypothetical protein n=1 Tax=Nioella sp. TaxID=1912091 RepID=UPI00355A8898